MFKIPKKTKIGAHIYKTIFNDTDNWRGAIDNHLGTIEISKKSMRSEQMATYWHEVLHGLNCQLTEVNTEFLANGITQVIIDNKL